jgi:hypothetical protein
MSFLTYELAAQQIRKKPSRVQPPEFKADEFEGIFFDDVRKQLVGTRPVKGSQDPSNDSKAVLQSGSGASETSASGTNVWKDRISGQSIEDLVKEGKRRLDTIVTTPAKFAAGSYKDARREFTLMTILFAAIENYPEEIRWKTSAAVGRARFGRVAANTKVGTGPAFNEAKIRMDDLATLLKGASISESNPPSEIVWPDIVDRGPAMQILEWALREQLNPKTASEAAFKSQSEEALKYAELISLIGETLHQPGMNDADDVEYKNWSAKMISEAKRVVDAVKLSNATMAREATGQLDQSCNGCHNTFR